jgi:hypothetical protein
MGIPVVVAGVAQPNLVAAPAQARAHAFPGLVQIAVRKPGETQLGVHLPEPVGGGRGEIAKALFARAQRLFGALALSDLAAQIQTERVQPNEFDHESGEIEQQESLLRRQASWRTIDDAQDADVVTVLGGQWRARVKADARRPGYERAVGKARIRAGIRDLQHRVSEHGKAAHGAGAERFLQRHAMARLEPLPLAIDERDQSDRRPHQVRRHSGDAIEDGVRWGIEDRVPVQGIQARSLVRLHATGRVAPARQRLVRRCSDHRASLSQPQR